MTTTPELLALRDACARIEAARLGVSDTSPAMERLLGEHYAAMSGSERALIAMQMFETAQQIVLSSLPHDAPERDRKRELCRRFYGEELARRVYG